ncbi:MAG: hypothetical protein U0821_24290 [Chloroflexota bacterium]
MESGVHFVKRSFLPAHEFTDLRDANAALQRWVRERAGTRDHGTTRRAPLALFEAEERAALTPLPPTPFDPDERAAERAQAGPEPLCRHLHAVQSLAAACGT